MKKALVTGAAGFIGSHVVRALLDEGVHVRALHLPAENTANLEGLEVERVAGDVTENLDEAMRGCDVVFHLAAVYALWTKDGGARMRQVNVDGTRNVFRAAREAGVNRVVYTSSIARFGGQGMTSRATEMSGFALRATRDKYSATKALAHDIAVDAARDQDIVIVAPCGPIGPGDIGPTPTGRLLLSALTLPVVVATPTMSNFADVRDMAKAHVLAAKRGSRGQTYLLGHRDLWMHEIAKMALDAAGMKKPIVNAPLFVANASGHALTAWANHVSHRAPLFTAEAARIAALGLRADCSKAVRELGMPQSPIEDAVADAVRFFQASTLRRSRVMANAFQSAKQRNSPTSTTAQRASEGAAPSTKSHASFGTA